MLQMIPSKCLLFLKDLEDQIKRIHSLQNDCNSLLNENINDGFLQQKNNELQINKNNKKLRKF